MTIKITHSHPQVTRINTGHFLDVHIFCYLLGLARHSLCILCFLSRLLTEDF